MRLLLRRLQWFAAFLWASALQTSTSSAEDMIKYTRRCNLIEQYGLQSPCAVWIEARRVSLPGFFAHAHASAGAAKTKANTRLYLILQRRADADAATSRHRREMDIDCLASAPGDSIAC